MEGTPEEGVPHEPRHGPGPGTGVPAAPRRGAGVPVLLAPLGRGGVALRGRGGVALPRPVCRLVPMHLVLGEELLAMSLGVLMPMLKEQATAGTA